MAGCPDWWVWREGTRIIKGRGRVLVGKVLPVTWFKVCFMKILISDLEDREGNFSPMVEEVSTSRCKCWLLGAMLYCQMLSSWEESVAETSLCLSLLEPVI